MGLGSCLIGFAVAAIKKDPSIQPAIGIPSEEEIHAVIALGYPDEVYQRVAGRKKVVRVNRANGEMVTPQMILEAIEDR